MSMNLQIERCAVAGALLAVSVAFVLLGKMTAAEWADYTKFVLVYLFAHHAVTSRVTPSVPTAVATINKAPEGSC